MCTLSGLVSPIELEEWTKSKGWWMPNLAHFWKKQRFKRHGASKAVNYGYVVASFQLKRCVFTSLRVTIY
jgi:hypothetical protein